MKISADVVTRIDWRMGLDSVEASEHGRIDGGLDAFSTIVIHEKIDPEDPAERDILALVLRDWSRGTECVLFAADSPTGNLFSDKDILGRGVDLDAILSLGWTPRMDEQDFPSSARVVEVHGIEAALGIDLKIVKGWRGRLRSFPRAALIVLRREARATSMAPYDPSLLDGEDWPQNFEEDPAEEGVAFVLL